MYNTQDNKKIINENLYNANVLLVDKNRLLNNDLKEERRIKKKAIEYILNKSVEYKPGYRRVDLNTKDCSELLNILEGDKE